MNATNFRTPFCLIATAVSLSFGLINAPAITKAPTGGANNLPARAAGHGAAPAANSNLTSAATVSGPASPEADDIREIRQPRHYPTPWLWVVQAAGVALLGATVYAVRHWLYHGTYFQMVPSEIALQRLEEARRLMDPDQAREYCFVVSKIIRNYLEDQLQLHAPRLTTEEFLRGLVEDSESITASHRVILGDFLQHCDLAKFAGWRYSKPDLAEMHVSAVEFVLQSSLASTRSAPRNVAPSTTELENRLAGKK